MAVALPIEQLDSGEIARTKINNSFQALSAQFLNSIPYIQDGYWYVNGENTGVPTSSGNLALRVNNGVLQWKNADSGMDWANLLKLSDLKGDPGESGKIYGADITDVTTTVDSERGITYLNIFLDDGTSRTVKLFQWNDLYRYPTQEVQKVVEQTISVNRVFFAKSTESADIANHTAVLVNPDSMEANGESYTPQYGDTVWVYFTQGCKVDAPTLNIAGTGALNIQLKNFSNNDGNHLYYYNFHIGANTWIKFNYLNVNGSPVWYTNDDNMVVSIYEEQAPWNIYRAVNEINKTAVVVITRRDYNALKNSGQLNFKANYFIDESIE